MSKAHQAPNDRRFKRGVSSHAKERFDERFGAWCTKEGMLESHARAQFLDYLVDDAFRNKTVYHVIENGQPDFTVVDISDSARWSFRAFALVRDDVIVTVLDGDMVTKNFISKRWHTKKGTPTYGAPGSSTKLGDLPAFKELKVPAPDAAVPDGTSIHAAAPSLRDLVEAKGRELAEQQAQKSARDSEEYRKQVEADVATKHRTVWENFARQAAVALRSEIKARAADALFSGNIQMASVLRELALGDESLPSFLEHLKHPENE